MNTTITARVSCVQKNRFVVECMQQDGTLTDYDAKLKGKFFNEQLEPPVVGDYVSVMVNGYGDALIDSVLPRKTKFVRPNRSGHADNYVKTLLTETIVSNFDYVFIVTSLNQDYSENRIARYVTLTLQTGAKPVILLSKADICDDVELKVEITQALSDKADVIAISSKTGLGIEEIRNRYLKPDVTVAVLGSSGVGKSTLLNTLNGSEIARVNAIRDADGKGRHTTTHRELYHLSTGTTIIDTPGLRELGILDVEEGLEETFSDVTALFEECRFNDCTHGTEPGCAVRKALEEGTLSEERWEMYQKLHAESNWGRDKMRRIAKLNRARQKAEAEGFQKM